MNQHCVRLILAVIAVLFIGSALCNVDSCYLCSLGDDCLTTEPSTWRVQNCSGLGFTNTQCISVSYSDDHSDYNLRGCMGDPIPFFDNCSGLVDAIWPYVQDVALSLHCQTCGSDNCNNY